MNFKERLKIALQRPTEFESGGYIKNDGGGDSIVYGAKHSQGGVTLDKNTELEGGGFTASGTPKAGEVITTVYDSGGNPNQFFMSHKNGIAQRYLAEKAANGGILPQQRKQDYARMNERANPDGNVQDIAANGGMGGCKECEENKYKYGGKPNQYFMGGALTRGGLSGRDIDWTSGALNRRRGYVEHEPRGLENGGMNYYDDGGKVPLKVSMGAENNRNCGPGLKNCRDRENPLTLQSYAGFEYDLANKLAGARANLGTQVSFGKNDTRSGTTVLQTGLSGAGSLNLDNVTNPNPDQNALNLNLDAYARLGYKKKGSSSSAKRYSRPTVEAGVEGSYDLINKNINNIGVYGRYGAVTGNAGYNLQTGTPTVGLGLKFDDGGVRKYYHGGPHNVLYDKVISNEQQFESQFYPDPNNKQSVNEQVKVEKEKIKVKKKEAINLSKKIDKEQTEIYSNMLDPIVVADAVGMTGIPVVSEVADFSSAAMSAATGKGDDALLSLAGVVVPGLGGGALKTGGKYVFDKVKTALNPVANFKPIGETTSTLTQSYKTNRNNIYLRDAAGNTIPTIKMLEYTNQTLAQRGMNLASNGWELAKTAGVYTGIYQGVKYVLSDDLSTATTENGEVLHLGDVTALLNTKKETDTIPSIVTPPADTTITYPSGNIYSGGWNDGWRVGQGTETLANGNKYEGEWKNSNFHGQGTYTWAGGKKYVGEWKDHKKNGQGTTTWADGDKYVGEYKDGKMDGQGTMTYADGRIEKGLWENDEFKGTTTKPKTKTKTNSNSNNTGSGSGYKFVPTGVRKVQTDTIKD